VISFLKLIRAATQKRAYLLTFDQALYSPVVMRVIAIANDGVQERAQDSHSYSMSRNDPRLVLYPKKPIYFRSTIYLQSIVA
jgi:hypothetical protein